MSAATVWTDGHFIAGEVALDFANTVYRRTPVLGADLLNTTQALRAWLARVGLLPTTGAVPDDDSDAALHQARALRALCWAIFDAQAEGRELPGDVLANLLDTARRGLDGDVAVGPDGSAAPLSADGVFPVLALHAISVALHPPPQGVRTCDRCGWFFIDTSRGRRRRWCSMQTCGNQAKAARYRSAHS